MPAVSVASAVIRRYDEQCVASAVTHRSQLINQRANPLVKCPQRRYVVRIIRLVTPFIESLKDKETSAGASGDTVWHAQGVFVQPGIVPSRQIC